jgi:hypothetical protein
MWVSVESGKKGFKLLVAKSRKGAAQKRAIVRTGFFRNRWSGG